MKFISNIKQYLILLLLFCFGVSCRISPEIATEPEKKPVFIKKLIGCVKDENRFPQKNVIVRGAFLSKHTNFEGCFVLETQNDINIEDIEVIKNNMILQIVSNNIDENNKWNIVVKEPLEYRKIKGIVIDQFDYPQKELLVELNIEKTIKTRKDGSFSWEGLSIKTPVPIHVINKSESMTIIKRIPLSQDNWKIIIKTENK